MKELKLVFFDFSRTIAKGSGFGAGPAFVNKKSHYDRLYKKYKSHNLNDDDYVKSVVNLWSGIEENDLTKIYSKIELNANVTNVLRKLKNMRLKLALVSNIPTKLAELYKTNLGFDYVSGTECEIKNGIFTGNVIKINADKLAVINNICDKAKIFPADCIAVGDSLADVKMFKAVGYANSIAYNASDEVKKYAKYHIKDFKELIKIIKMIK